MTGRLLGSKLGRLHMIVQQFERSGHADTVGFNNKTVIQQNSNSTSANSHRILNLFSRMDNYFPILIHLFLVAINLEAVLFIRPLLIYTEQASFTNFDTWIVGFVSFILLLFLLAYKLAVVSALRTDDGLDNRAGVFKEEFIEYYRLISMVFVINLGVIRPFFHYHYYAYLG